jgi:hypothetical protein
MLWLTSRKTPHRFQNDPLNVELAGYFLSKPPNDISVNYFTQVPISTQLPPLYYLCSHFWAARSPNFISFSVWAGLVPVPGPTSARISCPPTSCTRHVLHPAVGARRVAPCPQSLPAPAFVILRQPPHAPPHYSRPLARATQHDLTLATPPFTA